MIDEVHTSQDSLFVSGRKNAGRENADLARVLHLISRKAAYMQQICRGNSPRASDKSSKTSRTNKAMSEGGLQRPAKLRLLHQTICEKVETV